jgi:septal ring-binding cell division protein DamX
LDWLVERLGHGESLPYPVVWCSAHPRRLALRSWDASHGLTDLQPVVERVLQDVRVGMRIVFVTDLDSEDPSARSFGAIALGRILADCGKRVLLVDADLGVPGADGLIVAEGEEGLFDMLTAGASISRVMRAGPAANLWKMGVGSYRPASAASLSDEELRRVVSMFKGAFDVTLICAAAWDGDEKFHPLLVHSDRVIPCFHLQRSLGFSIDELTQYLNRQGVPLAGMIAFAAVEAAAAEPVPTPTGPEAPAGDRLGPATEGLAPETAAEEFDEDESSSPIFRWSLGIVGLLFLAFLSWWGWVSRGPADSVEPPPTDFARQEPGLVSEQELAGTTTAPETQAGQGSAQIDSTGIVGPSGGGAAETDEIDVPFHELVDDDGPTPEGEEAAAGPLTGDVETGEDGEDGQAGDQGRVIAEDRTTAAQSPPPSAQEPSSQDLRWEALREDPQSGYALHLWSFPDSLEANASAVGLRREGLGTRVLSVDLGARGRWYRVVVGRFATRAEAMAARELLAVRRDVDFVGVVRVR